ncbi:hypothetical protein BGZ90_006312, partial [Linnemannia elongata]
MIQSGTTPGNVQGLRSVLNSLPPSTTSALLDAPDVVLIDCYTDPKTQKDFILWEQIQLAFPKALFIRNNTNMIPFLAVQNILLNMSRRTPIGSTTHEPPYGNEPELTQDNKYIDSPESTSSFQDSNNGNAIETQRSEAISNATKRLNNPQDESAAKDMTLMQTMINANNGDIQAVVALGDRYKDGRELHQNYHAAMDWYCKAAEQGHPRAQFNIGLLYDQGHGGVSQDHSKAFEWFLKSALQGYADSQAKVSLAYTNGAGVPNDNIKAMEWSVKAAENGHAERQHYMGAAYENAQERVASAFEAGRGVPEDSVKAVEWYTKSADQGLPVAQFALGRVHELGLCGIPKDRSKAVGWYIKAAVQGYTEAQSVLREIYDLNTSDSDSDFALDMGTQFKVKEWIVEAADQGVVHAQCCMAYMYADGRGVETDNFKAFEWYLKAAEQGDEEAQRSIAYRYGYGIGIPESREKSVE